MALNNLSWSSFPGPLVDGDNIHCCIQNGAAAGKDVEIALTAGHPGMWWKAIMFTDTATSKTTEIWTKDGEQQSDKMVLPVAQMKGGTLEFKKAKALGVHTGMYLLTQLDKTLTPGTRVTFIWATD